MTIASEIAADSPYLWWPLDDTSGTTAGDDSGNGRDGTYNATSPHSPPDLDAGTGPDCSAGTNRSAEWDGIEGHGQRVQINDRPASGSNPTMSLEACVWISPRAVSDLTVLSMRGSSDVNREIAVVWDVSAQTFTVRWCNVLESGLAAPTKRGCWQHVALTSDGTTRRLYLDGNEVESWTGSHTLAAGTQLWYGADGRQVLVGGVTPLKPWHGRIAHCAAYSAELSSSDVNARVDEFCDCQRWGIGFVTQLN